MSDFCIFTKPRSGSENLARFLYKIDEINFVRHDKNNYEILHEHCVEKQNRYDVLDSCFKNNNNGVKIITINNQFDESVFNYFKNKPYIKIIILEREITSNSILSLAYARKTNNWHRTSDEKFIKIKLDYTEIYNSLSILKESQVNLDKCKLLENSMIIDYKKSVNIEGKKEVLNFLGFSWDDKYLNYEMEKKMTSHYSNLIDNYDEIMAYCDKVNI